LCNTNQCQNSRQRRFSRTRLDSGYEEDEPLLSNGKLSEGKHEESVDEAEEQSIDVDIVQTENPTTHTLPVQTQTETPSEVETITMLPSVKYEKVMGMEEKGLNAEKDLEKKKPCLSMKHKIIICSVITSIIIFALLMVIIFLLNQFNSPITSEDVFHDAAPKEQLPLFKVSEVIKCSNMCNNLYSNVSIINGWMACENDFVWLECHSGFRPSLADSLVCQDYKAEEEKLKCLPLPCLSSKTLTRSRTRELEDCGEEQVLLLAGGTNADEVLTSEISMYPSSPNLELCLPSLPLPLRWGALGLLGSTLLLCGGEDSTEQPRSSCWSLDNRSNATARWRLHSNMTRWD
jgi:uncharacterized protein YueI